MLARVFPFLFLVRTSRRTNYRMYWIKKFGNSCIEDSASKPADHVRIGHRDYSSCTGLFQLLDKSLLDTYYKALAYASQRHIHHQRRKPGQDQVADERGSVLALWRVWSRGRVNVIATKLSLSVRLRLRLGSASLGLR